MDNTIFGSNSFAQMEDTAFFVVILKSVIGIHEVQAKRGPVATAKATIAASLVYHVT